MTRASQVARTLSTWDLIVFGVLCVTPIAPIPLFGIAQQLSGGRAVSAILLAMGAMLLTAISYGRMASVYPVAGSAFSYIGRSFCPPLGFVAGWVMLLDYLLIPTINVIYCAVILHRLIPPAPYIALAAAMAALITLINLRGLRTGARLNNLFLILICAVLLWFVYAAVAWITRSSGIAALASTEPFYRAGQKDWHALLTATSFAALTYIGFDSVTTLAEDAVEPRKSIPIATATVCVATGVGGGLLIYLAQLVWPQYQNFSNVETAFLDVTQRVGGAPLFSTMTIVLLIAQFACALTGQAGASRLLFAMGREGALPRRWFARLDELRLQPVFAICVVGGVAFLGATFLTFEQGAELLNFGAFIAFAGVNLAAFKTFFIERSGRLFRDAVVPLLGCIFCLVIWVGLSNAAKLAGGLWLLAGIAYRFTPLWRSLRT